MKETIILKIESIYINTLAEVRNIPCIEVTEYKDYIWLKYSVENEEIKKKIYCVRFKNCYLLKNNLLFEEGKVTPEMSLFKATWIPINKYLPISIPTSAFSGQIEETELKVRLSIESYNKIETTIGILTTKKQLVTYIEEAPNFRFEHLTYALNDEEDIFIFGTPLLPIEGIAYWNYKNMLLPNGYILKSTIHLDLLEKKLAHLNDSFFLISKKGSYQILTKNAIKPLTRKAIIFET